MDNAKTIDMESSSMEMQKERVKWVDFAKFLAIIAVMIDHTTSLESNRYVAWLSYYSVSLFILIMGITSTWSYSGAKDALMKNVIRRSLSILRPYIIATIIFGLFLYKSIRLRFYLDHLVHFNMSAHFYFVLVYLQLLWVSPIIFKVLRHDGIIGIIVDLIGLVFCILLSWWMTKFSYIDGVYGGGSRVLGGTYLLLFYIGMCFGKYCNRIRISKVAAGMLFLLFLIGTMLWGILLPDYHGQIDAIVPLGDGLNPPSFSLCVYAILILGTIYYGDMIVPRLTNSKLSHVFKLPVFIGRHTLYIFLYHLFYVRFVFVYFDMFGIEIENFWIKRVLYIVLMILGSLLFEYILEALHKYVREAFYEKVL